MRSPKSVSKGRNEGVSRTVFPPKALQKNLSAPCLFWLLVAKGIPCLVTTSLQTMPPSSTIFSGYLSNLPLLSLTRILTMVCIEISGTQIIQMISSSKPHNLILQANYFSLSKEVTFTDSRDQNMKLSLGHHSAHSSGLLQDCSNYSSVNILKPQGSKRSAGKSTCTAMKFRVHPSPMSRKIRPPMSYYRRPLIVNTCLLLINCS